MSVKLKVLGVEVTVTEGVWTIPEDPSQPIVHRIILQRTQFIDPNDLPSPVEQDIDLSLANALVKLFPEGQAAIVNYDAPLDDPPSEYPVCY